MAEIYPQVATTNLTEVGPDIYQRAEVQDGWIILATDLQPGERVKLITETSAEVYEVTTVEANRFQVSGLTSDFSQRSGLTSHLFVYGREVTDFHTVDYEAISMLNVSATQEQQRIIEAQQATNQAQQTEIDTLKAQLQQQLVKQAQTRATFEARLQTLEAAFLQP